MKYKERLITQLLLLTLCSCSLGGIRTEYELSKLKHKIKVEGDKKFSNLGENFEWYFYETEVVLKEPYRVRGIDLKAGDSIFYDKDGNINRIIENGEYSCLRRKSYSGLDKAIKLYYYKIPKDECFPISISNYRWKEFYPGKEIVSKYDYRKLLFVAGEGYECNGEVTATALLYFKIANHNIKAGDKLIFKFNELWKINNKVVNTKSFPTCGLLRKNNYVVEY